MQFKQLGLTRRKQLRACAHAQHSKCRETHPSPFGRVDQALMLRHLALPGASEPHAVRISDSSAPGCGRARDTTVLAHSHVHTPSTVRTQTPKAVTATFTATAGREWARLHKWAALARLRVRPPSGRGPACRLTKWPWLRAILRRACLRAAASPQRPRRSRWAPFRLHAAQECAVGHGAWHARGSVALHAPSGARTLVPPAARSRAPAGRRAALRHAPCAAFAH